MANRFSPVSASDFKDAVAAFNRYFQMLDQETVTKIINQAGGSPAMSSGRIADSIFGLLMYDKDDARIIMTGDRGAATTNPNEPWLAITKKGYDVIEEKGE